MPFAFFGKLTSIAIYRELDSGDRSRQPRAKSQCIFCNVALEEQTLAGKAAACLACHECRFIFLDGGQLATLTRANFKEKRAAAEDKPDFVEAKFVDIIDDWRTFAVDKPESDGWVPELPKDAPVPFRIPHITWGISAVCLVLYHLQLKFPGMTQRFWFDHSNPFDPLRLFVAPLLHLNLNHLIANILPLFIYGSLIEEVIEDRKTVLKLFFHGAALGALFCYLFNPLHSKFGLGASGGVMALLTYFCLKFPKARFKKNWWFEGSTSITVTWTATIALCIALSTNILGFYLQYHYEELKMLAGPGGIAYLNSISLTPLVFVKTAVMTLFLVCKPILFANVFQIGFAAHIGGMVAAFLYWLLKDSGNAK